jgi:hypothetical protein
VSKAKAMARASSGFTDLEDLAAAIFKGKRTRRSQSSAQFISQQLEGA